MQVNTEELKKTMNCN